MPLLPVRRWPRMAAWAALLTLIVLAASVPAPRTALARIDGTKSCFGLNGNVVSIGDVVQCSVSITTSVDSDIPDDSSVILSNPNNNYTFNSAPTCSPGCVVTSFTARTVTIRCDTGPCRTMDLIEFITITSATPDLISQTVSAAGGSRTLTAGDTRIIPRAPGNVFYLAPAGTPGASDDNDCQSTTTPCLTLRRLLEGVRPTDAVVRDGDTVRLLAGTYTITSTVTINKLVTIEPDSSAKVIIKGSPGITMFLITAQGGPNLHVTFRNFTVGGNYRKGSAEPAFKLQNDSYTELSGNIIGAEDLPINNGIVLANSDHTLIRNNTIQGSTLFTFTPVLTIGKDVTGFGVVTAECLGTTNVNVSDAVTITNNLFTNLWVAAVWLCSDGAGEHEIRDNVFRNNWRGITLREVTDSRIIGNTLVDNRSDGIIVYGASLRNRIESNRVESHVAPSAAAIRIGWVADPIAPLDNRIEGNQLIRDTVAVHVFGARTTQIRNNEIKISGSRTAILLTTATVPGDPATQPRDTEITGNILVFTGPCAAPIGCAIRLSGVTAPVLATDNDWGLRRTADVEGVVWHNRDEEGLGLVTFTPFRNQQPEPTPAAGTTVITGGPPPGVPPFAPLPTPTPVSPEFPPAPPFFSSPTPTPTPVSALPMTGITFPTSPTLAGAGNGSFVTVSLSQGCSYVSWPGATDVSVVDAVQGILPSTARSGAVVWRFNGSRWEAWGAGRSMTSEVFLLRRNDQLLVCMDIAAIWQIPRSVGG